MNKKITPISRDYFFAHMQLCLFGSANGACAFTCTTVETCVCVDFVNTVVFGNSANGAFACASTATDASIFVDLVCHNRNSILGGTQNMLCLGIQPPLNTATITFYHIF